MKMKNKKILDKVAGGKKNTPYEVLTVTNALNKMAGYQGKETKVKTSIKVEDGPKMNFKSRRG